MIPIIEQYRGVSIALLVRVVTPETVIPVVPAGLLCGYDGTGELRAIEER